MNATASPLASTEFDEVKTRLKTTWMSGDYGLFARYLEKGAQEFFDRLGVKPGARVLDVACGAGQLALIAARAGADVSGCDIATNWLAQAREQAASEGVKVDFQEGDAECLPYADQQFDVVTSLLGAMFAPRPELVAAELTRVCRPGGTIAMANWTPGGFVGKLFKTIANHLAPARMPPPVLWGDEATVRQRLKAGISNVRCTLRTYHFEYPFPPAEVIEFFRANYGPMTRAFASLDRSGQKQLREELVGLWSAHNFASGDVTNVDAEYLEVIATREGGLPASAPEELREMRTIGRAGRLADRIEQGADALAAFAKDVPEADWRAPLSRDGRDRRPIGVIVHHVASVYPIEVALALAIASGGAVPEVTWEDVAELNAKHAREHAGVTKADALALLHQNSRNASATVRAFTDEELDRAAPFSLNYGAPVTAQFVIEDHALRHSWHHLARIRKALGR